MFRYKVAVLLFCIVLAGLSSCGKKNKVPDVEKISIEFLRFEKDLFSSDITAIADSLPFFKHKYGEFFELYNHKVINIGDSDNPAYSDYLRGFLTDYDMNQVKESIDSVFADFTPIENQITDVFSYFRYYFPKYPVPTVITCMSGFNQSMVSSDTILGIGLDRYLGRESKFYTRLGYANYMKQNMFPAKIPSDCARAWVMTQFPMNTEQATLMDHLLYQGKILYVTKKLLPEESDSLSYGFSESQISWLTENEAPMWTYLIENKLLFKTDYATIMIFIGEAPFTKGFGRNSPGKAATWLGYRIVSEFMDRRPEKSLEDLMRETDSQKLLREAKYKP